MRTIKFRAWDKNEKKMWEIGSLEEIYDGWNYEKGLDKSSDQIFMQFTGLTDRHGKEIWEGDLIKWGGFHICPVIFKDGAFQIAVKDKDFSPNREETCPLAFCEKDFEVLGNIYENPELLNNQQENQK